MREEINISPAQQATCEVLWSKKYALVMCVLKFSFLLIAGN